MNIAPHAIRFGAELNIDTRNFASTYGADAGEIQRAIEQALSRTTRDKITKLPQDTFTFKCAPGGNVLYIDNQQVEGTSSSQLSKFVNGAAESLGISLSDVKHDKMRSLPLNKQVQIIKLIIPRYVAHLTRGRISMNDKITPQKKLNQLLAIPPLPAFQVKELKTLSLQKLQQLSEKLQTQADQIASLQLSISKAELALNKQAQAS